MRGLEKDADAMKTQARRLTQAIAGFTTRSESLALADPRPLRLVV
jgi:hypothetical protein